MAKNSFKIGDRVRVYCEENGFKGIVRDIEHDLVLVEEKGECDTWYHYKQCRKLKVKPKVTCKYLTVFLSEGKLDHGYCDTLEEAKHFVDQNSGIELVAVNLKTGRYKYYYG